MVRILEQRIMLPKKNGHEGDTLIMPVFVLFEHPFLKKFATKIKKHKVALNRFAFKLAPNCSYWAR
jgi:hypothetical protein